MSWERTPDRDDRGSCRSQLLGNSLTLQFAVKVSLISLSHHLPISSSLDLLSPPGIFIRAEVCFRPLV